MTKEAPAAAPTRGMDPASGPDRTAYTVTCGGCGSYIDMTEGARAALAEKGEEKP